MKLSRLSSIFSVNLILCFKEVMSNRTRSLITSFGIFLGIASLLINMAFIRGMDDSLRDSMQSAGGLKTLTAKEIEPENTKQEILFQQSPGLSMAEAKKIASEIPEITNVFTFKDLNWGQIDYQNVQTYASFKAIDMNYTHEYDYTVSHGRLLTEEDIDNKEMVCLIGKNVADKLFGEKGDPLGKMINVNQHAFEIVGIVHSNVGRMGIRSYEFLFPYSVYEKRFMMGSKKITSIVYICNDVEKIAYVKKSLEEKYLQYHRGAGDVEIEASLEKARDMEKSSKALSVLLWCIAAISLGIGCISIMNIMFASIGNRIREIGIRKALGAKKIDIFMQFVIEAFGLCCIGGIPGMFLGSLVTFLPEGMLPYAPRLEYIDYGIGLVFIFLSGFTAGFFPAFKASALAPSEALRY